MKKLFIILLAMLCMLMISCNKKDNANNPATSVDKTEPNTSGPETSSPETTKIPETTKPPVPATTVPEQAGDPVLLPPCGEVTDFKYYTYDFPNPVRRVNYRVNFGLIFKSRDEIINFIEYKGYFESILEGYDDKEQCGQQIHEKLLKLLDIYDENFFEDTWLVLTYNDLHNYHIIDQVVDVYKHDKSFVVSYTLSTTIPKKDIKIRDYGIYHLAVTVLEISKDYLLDAPRVLGSELYPWSSINTIMTYGVDSKEAAELAENKRAVDLLKKYKKYGSYKNVYCEDILYIDAFLEKYQK